MVTSRDLNAMSELQEAEDCEDERAVTSLVSHSRPQSGFGLRVQYLSRLRLLHAVLGAGWPLAHFVSQKETQARHQCVGRLIHRRRGAQLLA